MLNYLFKIFVIAPTILISGCQTVSTKSGVASGQILKDDMPFLVQQCRDTLVHGNAYDEKTFIEKGYRRQSLNKRMFSKNLPGHNILTSMQYIRYITTENSCNFWTAGTLNLNQTGLLIISHLLSNGFEKDAMSEKTTSNLHLKFGDKKYVFSGIFRNGFLYFQLSEKSE